MAELIPDVIYAACVICTASDRPKARIGGCEFHRQDSPHFSDPPEKLFTIGLSPTSYGPATHYLCTRHASEAELDRIEAYQIALESAGKPRVPVIYYRAAVPIVPGESVEDAKASHESYVLASLNLLRIA
jgi:hypothetical protein